mgnify:CR=1 FL=1
MAGDEETISTGVDGFISLVRDSGKIEITEAANRMGVSRQVLEEWAAVLEEQGLVKIEYQLTKVFIIWIAKTKDEVEEKTSKISDIKATSIRQAESKLEELMELGRSLDQVVGQFKQISEIFELKMGGVKNRLDELRSLRQSRDEINFRSAELSEKFKKRIAETKGAVDASAKKAAEVRELNDSLGRLMKELEPTMVKIRVLATDADLQMERVQKNAKESKAKMAELERDYLALRKTSEELDKMAKESAVRIASVRKDVDMEGDTLISLEKSVTDKEKMHNEEITKQIEELDALVKNFESHVGRKTLLVGELHTMKRERDSLVSELEGMRRELLALDVTKGGVDTVLSSIEDVRKRIAEKEKRISEFQQKQKEVNEEIFKLFEMEAPPERSGKESGG